MLSRVADSVYWMSRYLERAEHTARLLDVNLNLTLDQGPNSGARPQQLLLESLKITLPESGPSLEDAYSVSRYLTFDRTTSSTIVSCISLARENARQVREQVSSEMYEQLNRLYLKVRATDIEEEWHQQPYEFYADVKESCHLIQGLINETMSHGEAWQFIRVGRSLERAGATANLLRAHCSSLLDEAGDGATAADYLEWVGLLKSCTSFEAYCREYTADLRPGQIVEFLLLEEETPRSVRFCANSIQSALESISEMTGRRKDSRLMRAAGKLRALLDYAQTDEILASGLSGFLTNVGAGCGDIHSALYATYIGYAVDNAIAA